ncbi:hypothetical protein LV779_21210 [Streptomyces thinghirensis]|nr:hypothetical protein [Streptomyces thinghirensis]
MESHDADIDEGMDRFAHALAAAPPAPPTRARRRRPARRRPLERDVASCCWCATTARPCARCGRAGRRGGCSRPCGTPRRFTRRHPAPLWPGAGRRPSTASPDHLRAGHQRPRANRRRVLPRPHPSLIGARLRRRGRRRLAPYARQADQHRLGGDGRTRHPPRRVERVFDIGDVGDAAGQRR